MPTKVIIGDVHARFDKARDLLNEIGVLAVNSADPMTDVRNPNFHVIQLGDVVSLGYGIKEADFLRWWFEVVNPDEQLVGNHELPVFHWNSKDVLFAGWEHKSEQPDWFAPNYPWEIGRDEEAVEIIRSYKSRFKVATAVGKWLITHAGVLPRYQRKHSYHGVDPVLVADDLTGRYERCQVLHCDDPVITSCHEAGGIFWGRDILNGYTQGVMHEGALHQIFGHTPFRGPKAHGERLWCLDTPHPGDVRIQAGVAALITNDEGESFDLRYVP